MSTPSSRLPGIRRTLIAAALAGAGLLVPATSARADVPTLSVGTGTLLAGGAAVQVAVVVTCSEGTGGASVTLLQRRGNTTVRGSTQTSDAFTCDGTAQSVNVLVVPDAGAFKAGEAVATAGAYVCAAEYCDSAQHTAVIRIER